MTFRSLLSTNSAMLRRRNVIDMYRSIGVATLSVLFAVCAFGGNELRPGEVIWECDGYAWRSLVAPIHDQPGEYEDDPIVIASDPEGCIWMNADGCMARFDGVGFEFDENMPGVYPSEQKLAIARDRISGDGYAAWIRKVIHHPKYSESYVIRYQDGESDWWLPHAYEYPDREGSLADVGIDSSGLVWMIGYLYFGSDYGVFRVDGDPNLDESWRFVKFPANNAFYIDCGGGKIDRCLLGFDGWGIGWVDEGTTSGTIVDLKQLGGSYDIKDVAIRVWDETAWVASEDGVFGYACDDGDCRMIDSYTPTDENWSSYIGICSDTGGSVGSMRGWSDLAE